MRRPRCPAHRRAAADRRDRALHEPRARALSRRGRRRCGGPHDDLGRRRGRGRLARPGATAPVLSGAAGAGCRRSGSCAGCCEPGRILISTAGSADLSPRSGRRPAHRAAQALPLRALGRRQGRRCRLAFERIACRQPDIEILAPTDAVVALFTRCGYRTRRVPYRSKPPAMRLRPRRRICWSPGARLDKGFDKVVALSSKRCRRGPRRSRS